MKQVYNEFDVMSIIHFCLRVRKHIVGVVALVAAISPDEFALGTALATEKNRIFMINYD